MMIHIKSKTIFFLIISFLILSYHSFSYSKDTIENKSEGDKYLSFENQMQDIDDVIARAKKSNKLALIVMGANWCHDSRSLAKTLFTGEVKEVIDTYYELLFINVGYMEKIKTVITRFGMPIIYGTPTALIIEPNLEFLINRSNIHLMRDAASLSINDTKSYFEDVGINRSKIIESFSVLNPTIDQFKLERLNQKIDNFESYLANRIYKAYDVVGPMIKEKKEGIKNKNYRKYWKLISKLRYKITEDLDDLRTQALKIAKVNKSNETLNFPTYPKFPWE